MSLTHLSLFTGIGGLDIAAEWAGFTTVGQCEWADFPTKVLENHWPDVPRWRDIHDLSGDAFRERTCLRTVDVISGGFPCQPFSVAGKQTGKKDKRYLWPEMLRIVSELKPRFVVGENVPGIMRIAAGDIVESLEREGYQCVLFDFEAAAVGAHHHRERIAFVAVNADCKQRNQGKVDSVASREDTNSAGICTAISDAEGARCERWDECASTEQNCGSRKGQSSAEDCAGNDGHSTGSGLLHRVTIPMGRPTKKPQSERSMRWPVEPDVGRVAHGVPDRVDRIKALGNAVVPYQFFPIFRAIAEELHRGE